MWSRWRVRILMALFVVGLIGGGIALIRLNAWVSHCRREAERCGEKAARWEDGARNYRLLAAAYERRAREKPEEAASCGLWARRDDDLAEQCARIATVYRARERRWRWWLGAEEAGAPTGLDLREPDWSPRWRH